MLFDGEFADTAISAFGLVHPPISATADEAYDIIPLVDALFGIVAGEHGLSRIRRVWRR